jgi:serine/threonine-protein kinase
MICPACQASNDDKTETCLHCGRGLYALTLGARLAGRYEIMGVLGRGGMGVVYLARDQELDETVAIKVLRTEIAGSEEAARRFRSEIKLARRIRHRNVCGIHEYGQEGQLRFIAMEYVEGSTLRQLLRQRGRLPTEEAFDVAIEVAEGLQAVHDAGIIHRDLKATNVMLDRDGAVRLMDFGIAKQLQQEDTTGITGTAQMIGTPEYMSPEQVRSEKLDGRSDVYSLGILIFELFTGELPFHGDTPMSVILAQLETPPPLDGVRATWLPRPLVPVLRRALAKDRNERYRSTRELAEALRSARAALAGPTLAEARPALRAATAAQPLAAPADDHLPTQAPTPVSTPTPVVAAATTPLPRSGPAPREGPRAGVPVTTPAATRRLTSPSRLTTLPSVPESGRRMPSARYLIAGGAVLAALGLFATSMRPPPSPPGPSAAPATAAPSTAPAAVAVPPTPASLPPTSAPRPATSGPLPTQARAPSRAVEARPGPPDSAPEPDRAEVRSGPTLTPLQGTEAPAASARPALPAVDAANGTLKLHIVPWAEVSLDGRPLGTTPLKPLSLPPGAYTVRLQNPSYRPLQKRVNVRPGEVFVLDVDLEEEAFPVQAKEQ